MALIQDENCCSVTEFSKAHEHRIMPAQANQPLAKGYQLQGYRIADVLSCGGFSIVYLAYDRNDEPVAIKEYLPACLAIREAGAELPSISAADRRIFLYGLKCFFEEGRSLASLSHANVVRVLNFFRANETAYLVMRYEHGRTMQQHVRAELGTLKEDFLRNTFVQLLNGLREVHAHKLLHLDIKPANIYIRTDNVPILIDFGAARQTLTSGKLKLSPMCTPGFAPAEQYRSASLGPWSDIYSVGATLFTCLAGCAPQSADQRLRKDRYVSATRIWRGKYSRELLETVDWCLEMEPLQRPPSVFALQKVLMGAKRQQAGENHGLLTRVRAGVKRAMNL